MLRQLEPLVAQARACQARHALRSPDTR